MNEEKFKEFYKNVKKEEIIEELYYKCEANKELYIGYERLNNIINELEKDLKEAYDCLVPNELINGRELIDNISNDLKELKENKYEIHKETNDNRSI